MIRGLSGSLLSHEALSGPVPNALCGLLGESDRDTALRRMRAWYLTARSTLGPTAGVRAVFDLVAVPLVAQLGFRAQVIGSALSPPYAVLQADARSVGVLLAAPWGADMAGVWRDAVRRGIGHDVRWCLCVNGPGLRLFDATRAYSRRFADFDLARALDDEATFAVFWGLLRAAAFSAVGREPVLDQTVSVCERHRAAVRESLKTGVHDALVQLAGAFLSTAGRSSEAPVLEESLTVIYRVLFLLFAEARGLVPQWHPIYRDSYTVESLRFAVETEDRPRGLWASLQAIARLAHRGCRAGTLRVAPFNGRLFSPADAPLAESVRLDDAPVRRAMLALTTRPGKDRRERISYADLGVEQLGAVYEHVLDFAPARTAGGVELRPSGRRKATGTFYTPRSLTEYLVRRTLAPLVAAATPDEILRLRVVDPAMGSGAFLVAACRYLASAYEQALVREGGLTPSDIDDTDRTSFRRTVAQRCLFGVDINPMAVQLARLSLWLATLAADRPLTFLDHHLRTGDSLVGASLADILRQPPAAGGKARQARSLPLFTCDAFEAGLRAIVPSRLDLAHGAGDTIEEVRNKERTLARLTNDKGPLARWKSAADLWCAGWFSPASAGRAFGALLHEVLDGRGPLPSHVSGPLLQQARSTSESRRFFHWTLEFPEVFYREDGAALDEGGFDAVLGNPPWEMLRADRKTAGSPADLTRFTRGSGIYRLQGAGHPNLYQLFIERAVSLLRPQGRLGFIVPWGLAADHGCAALRRAVIGGTAIDTFLTFENRDAIFPVHRSLKFTLVTLTGGGSTATLPSRAGVRTTDALDRLPDVGPDPAAVPLRGELLRRISGDDLAIPDIRSRDDLRLVSRIAFSCPALGDPDGWNLQFGRELNASDDRPHFTHIAVSGGLPVIEGKHVQPFRVDTAAARFSIARSSAARLLRATQPFLRPRLAYRDVASAGNRLTLIAAIVPAGVVTTHTLFCLKTPSDLESQHFLCAIFNSFVANYLIRMRVSTHVSAALIARLPVPKPVPESADFQELAALGRRLSSGDRTAAAEQQARAARLYGLGAGDFPRILEGFPLVPRAERDAALSAYRYIVG